VQPSCRLPGMADLALQPPPPSPVGCNTDDGDDFKWFWPPTNVHDVAAWDHYWVEQVAHGLTPPLFDIFNHDENLVRVMVECGMWTVLCAGNGISQEPRALAAAGFQATGMDVSPKAIELAQAWKFSSSELHGHQGAGPQNSEGRAEFVVGNILDPALCPGPFDVIIERRTLQLFSNQEVGKAIDALASRLTEQGILLSHCHNSGWKPGQKRIHPLEALLQERGWKLWTPAKGSKPKSRVIRYSNPSSLANAFHFPFTTALVFSSIRISSGQGRVKPSLAHLRVASTPIFEP